MYLLGLIIIFCTFFITYCYGADCDMYFFVTNDGYRPGNDFQGKAGADAICQGLAQDIEVEGMARGEFRSFLSTATTDIRDEIGIFSANVCLLNNKVLTTGTTLRLFETVSDTLQTMPNKDETGGSTDFGVDVWTGSNPDGRRSGQDCNSWTSSAGQFDGTTGRMDEKNQFWLQDNVKDCSEQHHLYCYEVIPRPNQECRTIFVTTETVAGDFGGYVQADAICASASTNVNTLKHVSAPVIAGLVEYKAVFSDENSDAVQRLGLGAGGAECVKRVDGQLISTDGLLLRSVENPLLLPVLYTNEGVTSSDVVWTGSTNQLVHDEESSDCQSWQTKLNSFLGLYGNPTLKGVDWISDESTGLCINPKAFYCLSVNIGGAQTSTSVITGTNTASHTTDIMSSPIDPSGEQSSNTNLITSNSGQSSSGGVTSDGIGLGVSEGSIDNMFTDPSASQDIVLFVIVGVVVLILLLVSWLLCLVLRRRKRRRRRPGSHVYSGTDSGRRSAQGARSMSRNHSGNQVRRSRTSSHETSAKPGPQLPDHIQLQRRSRVAVVAVPTHHYASAPAGSDFGTSIPMVSSGAAETYGELAVKPVYGELQMSQTGSDSEYVSVQLSGRASKGDGGGGGGEIVGHYAGLTPKVDNDGYAKVALR